MLFLCLQGGVDIGARRDLSFKWTIPPQYDVSVDSSQNFEQLSRFQYSRIGW